MVREVKARSRRFREHLVFVPWLNGTPQQIAGHQRFAADLGYNSTALSLTGSSGQFLPQWKLRRVWVDEIQSALNSISGRKILYSFSLPSLAVAQAIGQSEDAVAWICEGGPFYDLPVCMWNYFSHVEPIRLLPLKLARIALSLSAIEFLSVHKEVGDALDALPDGFRVLSVRSWQDPLVAPKAIEKVFAGKNHLRLETLNLPESGHLRGLYDSPQDYMKPVSRFLRSVSTPIPSSEISL